MAKFRDAETAGLERRQTRVLGFYFARRSGRAGDQDPRRPCLADPPWATEFCRSRLPLQSTGLGCSYFAPGDTNPRSGPISSGTPGGKPRLSSLRGGMSPDPHACAAATRSAWGRPRGGSTFHWRLSTDGGVCLLKPVCSLKTRSPAESRGGQRLITAKRLDIGGGRRRLM